MHFTPMSTLPKIIVVLGATATGKTDFGIWLAKKFKGEIVSADSRQVYKHMRVGTAQPKGRMQKPRGGHEVYMVKGIRHHLMNWLNPDDALSVAEFKDLALKRVGDIVARKKVPIVVGGTGLYIWSLIDNLQIPAVSPNFKLRKQLGTKSVSELSALLRLRDPVTAAHIDIHNPRRVIRALEVVAETGTSIMSQQHKGKPLVEALQLGIRYSLVALKERIAKRTEQQFEAGLVKETRLLLKAGYSPKLPSMTGIGYRECMAYLNGEMTLEETKTAVQRATYRYAKRQMTWFKRDMRIRWLEGADLKMAEKLVKAFLR